MVAYTNAEVPGGFRAAMGQLATGVVMVTCSLDGKPWGLTVSACCSVSVAPPLLLVSLGAATASSTAIAAGGRFGVSILGERLLDVARFGSAKGQPKFVQEYCDGSHQLCQTPVVANALAHVDCTVERAIAAGDHVIYLGRVENIVHHPGDRPLVYYDRAYHRLGESTDLGPVADETVDSLLYDYPMPRTFTPPPRVGSSR